MKLSYVIVTRNRRDALLATLAKLEQNTGLPRHAWEVFVIDNASEDDTASAVTSLDRDIRVIRLPENEGVPARNHALPRARGKYVCFLDDDSYPMPGAVPAALTYLGRHPKTAAVVARVVLPDGRLEAPALPTVTIGGASVVRKAVLDQVGGFAPEFFRQAEEYDLSFRVWEAGYRVERFEDVLFGHDKVADPAGRSAALTRRMDLRNNLILAERYLPRPLRRAYRHDWLRRYAMLGLHDGHRTAVNAALKEAGVWARREAAVGRKTLSPKTVEQVFGLDEQAKAVAAWAKAHGLKRVAIGDYGKNVYATWLACRRAGLTVAAVLDNAPAFTGSLYRGTPVVPDAEAPTGVQGVVLSNINPAQIEGRMTDLTARFTVPVLRLWHPRTLASLGTGPAKVAGGGAKARGMGEAA